jgi:hypothetical protein
VETGIDRGDLAIALKAMKELGADNSVIEDAGLQSALILVNRARPLIPVKTGRLAANAQPVGLVRGGQARVLGSRVPYANPIHWGWLVVSANHKGTLKPGTYRGIAPQPFFSEALGYSKEEIFRTYDRLMQDYINKLGAK